MSCVNTTNFENNPCNTGLGGAYFVPNSCLQVDTLYKDAVWGAYSVQSPSAYRYLCSQIGDGSDEWIPLDTSPNNDADEYVYDLSSRMTDQLSCPSDSCNKYQLRDEYNECCEDSAGNDCCGRFGLLLPCVRQSYKGNPLRCCFNDMDGVGTSGCWAGPDQNGTCHPCQRDITSDYNQTVNITNYNEYGQEESFTDNVPCSTLTNQLNSFNGLLNCRDIAMSYCTGSDLDSNDPNWIYRWIDNEGNPLPYDKGNPSCYYALLRNLGEGAEIANIGSTNDIGNRQEQICIPRTLANIPPDGLAWSQRLMNIVFAKYTRLGFQLPSSIGSSGYNSFQRFLHNYVCCPYPIICQQGLQATCRSQTMDSISRNPQLLGWCGCYLPEEQYTEYINTYGINKSCVPACNSTNAIKLVSSNNIYTPCTQGVCIIDDITINITNSSGGDISLNQLCNCNNCTCIVSGTDITAINSEFGDININNKCGSFQCIDSNGNLTSCISTPRRIWLIWSYVIIALLIIVIFIGLCIYLVTRRRDV